MTIFFSPHVLKLSFTPLSSVMWQPFSSRCMQTPTVTTKCWITCGISLSSTRCPKASVREWWTTSSPCGPCPKASTQRRWDVNSWDGYMTDVFDIIRGKYWIGNSSVHRCSPSALRTCGQTSACTWTGRCSTSTQRSDWPVTDACAHWPCSSRWYTPPPVTSSFMRVKAWTCSASLCQGHWRSSRMMRSSLYWVRF